jgi:GT2 family glycosyltransferase/tetratricopeptide (TPR) repeat protein
VLAAGPCYVFVSRLPWSLETGDWERCASIAEKAGATVVLGDWDSEQSHREAAHAYLIQEGFRYAITIDCDEVVEPLLLENLLKIAKAELADAVHVQMDTYWKSAEYVIRPREALTPVMLIDLLSTQFLYIREFEAKRRLVLTQGHGVLHHLSYAGPNERIIRKISTWSHKDEVIEGWYGNVWLGWDSNKMLRNLHPTHPAAYGMTERIALPDALKGIVIEPRAPLEVGSLPPTTSIVIPLKGGEADIKQCLDSLSLCQDLFDDVVIVDNASTDKATDIAETYPFVRLIRNAQNEGFGRACNQGFWASIGTAVVFLNSDTVVPRAGLARLLESLWSSGSIAAAGPYTNNCGHLQRIVPTYTTFDTLDLFAEDFSTKATSDLEVDMLVGFCVAVRRSVLDELGVFDERFGIGTFEDNDLCYRLRRSGYRLVIATRSYVHHHGSRTLGTMPNYGEILAENERKFITKWRDDLDTGFASSLSGLQAAPIVFNAERHPDRILKEIRELAHRADVSLCMIVKDEERTLDACLSSAKAYFNQIIVVDTGSTDRTIEIAKSHGVEVYEHPWEDSFSTARNYSMQYAKGRWIFWMDADDTLPRHTGESILRAAVGAPQEVAGFVIPVQFVEEGAGAGTRVDHVKLFRNVPGLAFEGRIHEQILSSLREHGEIARIEAVVLHSGYDTSDQGQKKKRERDFKLLALDAEERPNHPFVLFCYGMTYHYTDEHELAIGMLTRSIEHSNPKESHLRKAYALKSVSLKKLDRKEEALKVIFDGIEAVGDDPELRFQAALILTELGRLEEAREQYLLTAEDVSGHFSSLDIGILGFKRYHNLAVICDQLGSYAEARDWWLKALEAAPTFLPSAFELFDAALKHNDPAIAGKCLECVLQTEGPRHNWLKMSEKLALSIGGPEYADWTLRKALIDYPHSREVRLALTRFYLSQERVQEAIPHLRELNHEGVAEAAYFLGVIDIRSGRFATALQWMERAFQLNPNHQDTLTQIENLRRMLSQKPE